MLQKGYNNWIKRISLANSHIYILDDAGYYQVCLAVVTV